MLGLEGDITKNKALYKKESFLKKHIFFKVSMKMGGLTLWSSALREKCPYSELFESVFSRIWTEHGELRSIFLYSVRMRENTDQNNSEYGHFLRSAKLHIFLRS